jgi:hypothetical protein
MFTAYVVVTVLAAAANLYGASADFTRPDWIVANMDRLGISQAQLVPLGALKAAGGIGLLVGLAVPEIGAAAGVGLVLYFVGAIITVLRSRWYEHLPYPTFFLVLSAGSLGLLVAS